MRMEMTVISYFRRHTDRKLLIDLVEKKPIPTSLAHFAGKIADLELQPKVYEV
jgi:hypothetical protein